MSIVPRLYRVNQLASTPDKAGLLPVSKNTIWRWVAEGKFPAPRKIGVRTTVWDAEAVEFFIRTHNQAEVA